MEVLITPVHYALTICSISHITMLQLFPSSSWQSFFISHSSLTYLSVMLLFSSSSSSSNIFFCLLYLSQPNCQSILFSFLVLDPHLSIPHAYLWFYSLFFPIHFFCFFSEGVFIFLYVFIYLFIFCILVILPLNYQPLYKTLPQLHQP